MFIWFKHDDDRLNPTAMRAKIDIYEPICRA